MAEKTCKLKVVGLPPDVTADQLTIIFKNKRGKGGGPVENVQLKNDGQNMFAIITFSAPDAVELIMSRGNTVAVRDVEANVEPLYDQIETVQKSSPLGDIENVKTVPDKPIKKPKPIKPKIAQSEKLYEPTINTKPVAPEFYMATSNDKKDTEIFPWDVTVKAYLAELSQTREFYKYYLEDEDINKAPFYEESLMLDGVNKVFYVTFHDRKGAMAFCNKKHNITDSYITKVQKTTQEDFNTFDNLLFIYGYNIQIEDDLEYLKELVTEHSDLDVSDIIHYEEAPGSAIIVFEPETDITAATWLCTTPSLRKQNLITGLVFKEYGILVTGLNDSITLSYLTRYMKNKGNGGGKVKSVNFESSNSAVVTFEEESDYHNILQKEDHVINGTHLTLSPFYTCLSKEYQKKFHLGETTPIKSSPQFTVGKAPAVRKASIQSVGLRNKQINLYTSDTVKNERKRYFGFLTLIHFGFEFLRKHQQQLEEVVREQYCEMELLPNLLKLKLNWSQKVTGREVREMLNAGLAAVKQHLDKYTVLQFEIPEPEIFNFQSFCQKQGDMGIFFDHGWKKAVVIVIGLKTPQHFENMMNDMFSAYLSQQDAEGTSDKNKESKDFRQRLRPPVKPKPGFLQDKTFQAPVDGSENFQAPSQAPPQASPQAPTLEDVSTQETFNIEEFLDLETYELILLDKSKFLVEIEEKYKPIKVVLDFENKKVVFKANESDKIRSAQFDVLKKSKDDFQKLKLDDLSPEQMELLKHSEVLSRINSNLNNGHLQVSSEGMVTLYYIKPEEPGSLKEKITTEVFVMTKPVDPDMVTMLKSSKGSTFLTDLSAPVDGIKMRSVIKLDPHGKHLMIIAPKHQQLLLNKSVEDFLDKNKLHTINVPFSSGKLAFVNRYLKQEVARIASSLGSDVEMKPTSESYAIKGLQDVAKKGSALMKQLSDTIVVQDVNLKFFGIQEFLEDAQGKTLIRNIEDRNMCIIFSKSDLDKMSKQQAPGKPQIQGKPQVAAKPRKPPTLIAKSVIKNVTVHFLQGDLINLNVDAIVNPMDATLEMSSPMSKALVSQGGQEILTALKSSSSDVSVGSVITTPPGQLSNMKHILHVVCPVNENEEEIDDLKKALASCLQQAESQNIVSVGFPAVGVGKHFKFPARAACNCLINAIHNYIEEGSTALTKIYLCDFKSDVVQMMMDRFEDFSESALETIAPLQASDTKGFSLPDGFFTKRNSPRPSSSHSSHAAKDFGNIKFNLVLGEINKQKADVMVTTVDKNLDLSKGRLAKTIASEGGPQLQQELRDNYNDGLKPGEFAESSGGSLPCKHIFYAYLPRCRPGQESIIEKLVFKLLEKAEQCQAATIALPALGTGNLGYPPEISANLITDAVCQFAKKYKKTTLKFVNLVVFHKDKDVEQAFNTVLSTGGRRGGKEEDESQGSGGDAHQGAGYFGRLASRLPFGNSQKGEEAVIMYNKTKLKIKSGDITKEKCDGLVNSIKENMDLSSSGQVCKALLRICGQELQDECTNKISEMAQEGVVSTSGSKLKCKNILHISQDKFTRHWDKGVTKVLEEADKLGIKTLALPALGAGSRHADVQVIKKQILGAIEQFSATGKHTLSYIKLVIFDRNVLDAFLGHSQRGAHSVNEPEGENVIHKEYSQNMDLKIYCNDAFKMKSAIDQLKKECKSAFKEEKEKEPKVKMLDKAQLKELERVGLKNGIQVQVRVEEGLMLMHGFNASGMLAVQRCLQKFVVEAVDSHHKSLHRAMVSAIVWEYKKGERWHKFEPLLNSELEKEFKNKSSQHELTDAKGRKYIIDFKELKETLVNDRGSKSYEIQRRDKTKEGEPVPKKWDPMPESENLKIVEVKPGSPEYKTVEQHYINGGAPFPVKMIKRIQNKTLYKQYSVRKRDLDLHNPKGHKNELKLFHGTSAAPVPQINENGFNRSYCGVNGTVHGNGVYFHMRSSYSVNYAKPDSQGNRHMYQAKVLVGESTACHSGMNVLPNKPGTNRIYDSGNAGEIYVIFHDANAYPEYLITF